MVKVGKDMRSVSIVGAGCKPADLVGMNWIGGADALNPTVEDPWVSTNGVAQWNLEAIIMQELLPDNIPSLKDIKPASGPRR